MRIAHLSDPHLCPPGQMYQGEIDSSATFAAALRHLGTLDTPPDLLILSGDLTEDGKVESYTLAGSLLADLSMPILLIPGNHDNRTLFRRMMVPQLPDGPLHFARRVGPMRVIGIDVTPPGEHHGDFDAGVEAWLGTALAEEPNAPTLVVMHQPPFRTGIPYIDAYRCFNADRLEAVIGGYRNVQGILCGHIHRFAMCRFASTIACTAPSTATTIALRTAPAAEPASYIEPPGYLLHDWDGERLITHHVPVGDFPGPFNFF